MNNSCNNCENTTQVPKCHGNGFLIIIVLYILLAIILGSYWY